jgi:uncharacterized protein
MQHRFDGVQTRLCVWVTCLDAPNRLRVITPHGGKTNVKPSLALDLQRPAVRAAMAKHRASNPRVFGSALYGTDREGSDLDLLVDTLPGATLFDLGGLQSELESLLGVPVDVLTLNDLPVKFRAQVLAESRAV